MNSTTMSPRGALLACLICVGLPAGAQTLDTAGPPADFPPGSYEGRQFVDSRGCVYIRAGVDGNVTWVPRVNRDREQLCGFEPTFADASEPEAPADRQAPEREEQVAEEQVAGIGMEADGAAEAETAAAPAPDADAAPEPDADAAPGRDADTAPATSVKPRVPARTESASAPQQQAEPRPRLRAGAQGAPASALRPSGSEEADAPPAPDGSACPEASRLSQHFLVAEPRERIRCGPQAKPPYSFRVVTAADGARLPEGARVYRYDRGGARNEAGRTADLRVLPRHLWQPPEPASAAVSVPEGYEPAWQDDRLNPRRAEQTLDGRAQMNLIWTDTTPRRLIDRASGEDVTADHPRLVYPFTDMPTQQAYMSAKDEVEVQVASDGRVRLLRKEGQGDAVRVDAPAEGTAMQEPVRLATRSNPPEAQAPAARRFVQVGTFGQPENAARTADRLGALGLPVRVVRDGKHRLVLAGPFDTRAELRGALDAARGAGFADAFARN